METDAVSEMLVNLIQRCQPRQFLLNRDDGDAFSV